MRFPVECSVFRSRFSLPMPLLQVRAGQVIVSCHMEHDPMIQRAILYRNLRALKLAQPEEPPVHGRALLGMLGTGTSRPVVQ
jgi:hypothetical protein